MSILNAYRDEETSIGPNTEKECQQMNYNKLYSRFIESKRSRPLIKESGYEFHHILPKSLGGSNQKNNLVKLSHKEHLKAHEYLARMYKGDSKTKMEIALGVMKHDRSITKKTSIKLWKDSEYRKKQSQSHKIYAQNNQDKYASEMRRRWQNPIFREKILASRRKTYNNPEWKKRTSIKRRAKWQDPEYRFKVTSARWKTYP
jgi:hypothetical protein